MLMVFHALRTKGNVQIGHFSCMLYIGMLKCDLKFRKNYFGGFRIFNSEVARRIDFGVGGD